MAWFESWFDSRYYPLLYDHRNEEDAKHFLSKLTATHLTERDSTVLDACCGRGRHSGKLHELGFNVTGFDLSAQSIEEAKASYPGINFLVHDLREPLPLREFDYVLNLFTSFGYFEDPQDDAKAFNALSEVVKPGGLLVIDFMNSVKVANTYEPESIKETNGVRFISKRWLEDGYIRKTIDIKGEQVDEHYEEHVRLLELEDFLKFAEGEGMQNLAVYGNYELEGFAPETSDRLILVFSKPE